MAKRKSQPREQQEGLLTGTDKLANTAIKAYKHGGIPLSLIIGGLILLILGVLISNVYGDVFGFVLIGLGVFVHLWDNTLKMA